MHHSCQVTIELASSLLCAMSSHNSVVFPLAMVTHMEHRLLSLGVLKLVIRTIWRGVCGVVFVVLIHFLPSLAVLETLLAKYVRDHNHLSIKYSLLSSVPKYLILYISVCVVI